MSFEPLDYLRHMLAEADFLISESQNLTIAEFKSDAKLQRAFIRSLEVIGEAAKNIPASFRAQYPDIDWRAMAGMRDRLIHGYFGVDYDLIWAVAVERVPELRRRIVAILEARDQV